MRRWAGGPELAAGAGDPAPPTELGLVRGSLAAASEERLLIGAAGYLTSWAAMHPEWSGMHGALEHVGPILARYLEGQGPR